MIRHRLGFALSAVLFATGAYAQSSDTTLARDIAASCSACHGTSGKSMGVVPSLAAASRADLIARMQEFKTDKRPGTIMPQLAKGYTDEQIERAATYFASQPAPPR